MIRTKDIFAQEKDKEEDYTLTEVFRRMERERHYRLLYTEGFDKLKSKR